MKAFIFPGQGKSVSVSMGKALAETFVEAKEVFQEVDDALSQHLTQLMWEGPEEELTLTENAQPALMAVGMALIRVLENQTGKPIKDQCHFVAGHSLGEYTALTAAGMFTVADCARVLKERGKAMQKAVPPGVGAMAALLGSDMDTAKKLVEAASTQGICEISNDNAPNQIVVSGHAEAVDYLIGISGDYEVKRVIKLPVSAPFHCSLMEPAAERMKDVLASTAMSSPHLPIVSNVTAEVTQDKTEIADLLVQQVTKTVRWRESVDLLAQKGVESFIELGPGKVLTGLVRSIAPNVTTWCLHEPQEIEDYLR